MRWAKRLKWAVEGNEFRETMELVKTTARESLETVKEMLPAAGQERPRLTREEQLDYFFKHTGEDFDALRQRVGDDEFEKYFAAMRKLAERP